MATESPGGTRNAVEAGLQLVVEIHVTDLVTSVDWYRDLGFKVIEEKETFVAVGWESGRLFLKAHPEWADADVTYANVRVLVADVDRYWTLASELGLEVVVPIGDRAYGIRDFTVADPDGFGIRFGTSLADLVRT